MTTKQAYLCGFIEKQAQLLRNLRSAWAGNSPMRQILAILQGMPEHAMLRKLNLLPAEETPETSRLAHEISERSR
jgi:hypothetical protein